MTEHEIPFPTRMTSKRPEIERDYYILSDTRSDDPGLHYRVTVPKSWKMLDTPPGTPDKQKPIASLGVLRATEGPAMEMEVRAAFLSREIEPADWLGIWIATAGQQIVHSRTVSTAGGDVLDALTVHRVDGQRVFHRWIASKNGQLLLVADARGYEDSIVDRAETYFIAATSAKFIHQQPWPLAEQLATFSRAEPAEFLLAYPKSWHLQLDPHSGDAGLSLNLLNLFGDAVLGTILFAVVPGTDESPETLRDRAFQELVEAGHQGVLPPFAAASPTPGLPTRVELVAPITRRDVPHEIRMSVGTTESATFLIGVVGPARERDEQVWAINKRAYRLVLNQLETEAKPEGAQ